MPTGWRVQAYPFTHSEIGKKCHFKRQPSHCVTVIKRSYHINLSNGTPEEAGYLLCHPKQCHSKRTVLYFRITHFCVDHERTSFAQLPSHEFAPLFRDGILLPRLERVAGLGLTDGPNSSPNWLAIPLFAASDCEFHLVVSLSVPWTACNLLLLMPRKSFWKVAWNAETRSLATFQNDFRDISYMVYGKVMTT